MCVCFLAGTHSAYSIYCIVHPYILYCTPVYIVLYTRIYCIVHPYILYCTPVYIVLYTRIYCIVLLGVPATLQLHDLQCTFVGQFRPNKLRIMFGTILPTTMQFKLFLC